MNVEQSQLPVD